MSRHTTKKPEKGVRPSIGLVESNEKAQATFVKAVGKPKEGDNSYVDMFLALIASVMGEKRSFTLSELQTLAKPYDIPPPVVAFLAEKWVRTMEGLGLIALVKGCYDEDVICFN